MTETSSRPAWFTRREISPFILEDEAVEEILGKAMSTVVSWVTKDNKPVSAVMSYVMVDGVITLPRPPIGPNTTLGGAIRRPVSASGTPKALADRSPFGVTWTSSRMTNCCGTLPKNS